MRDAPMGKYNPEPKSVAARKSGSNTTPRPDGVRMRDSGDHLDPRPEAKRAKSTVGDKERPNFREGKTVRPPLRKGAPGSSRFTPRSAK